MQIIVCKWTGRDVGVGVGGWVGGVGLVYVYCSLYIYLYVCNHIDV